MGSLSNCIKKAGKAISPSEAADLQATRKELMENGMSGQEATEKAIAEMISGIEQERADLAAKIEAKGGFVEPIAKDEVKPAAASADQIQPAAKVEPVAETPKETKLENFGEALPPARRNTSLNRDLTDEDIKSLPLSKIWPADEIDQIEDKYTAALAYAIREEIPSKPRVSYKLKRWVDQVKAARDIAKRFIEIVGKDNLDAKMRASSRQLAGFSAKVTVLNEIDRSDWKRVGEVKEYPDAYTYKDGVEIKSPFVSVTIDGNRMTQHGAKSVADVIEKVKEELAGNKADSAPRMQFEVRTNSQTKKSFINKKGDREYRKLAEFDDVKSAFAYIKSNYDDLVSAWEGVKDKDNVKKTDVRRSENRPRTGKDRRNGKDVTPEMFADVFGFRGVEFGKWVKQGSEGKDRQGLLNQAYDAMLDLAEIVGIPPKAISLDGTLGLALGARGVGWGAAHYEPNNLVINLTKTKGAGAFAHEWFHALDNYFSRKRGVKDPISRAVIGDAQLAYREASYITYKPEPMYVNKKAPSKAISKADLERRRVQYPDSAYFAAENWMLDPSHPGGVRPEVEKAFAELVKALNESPMAARAKMNDKGPDGYWSRIIERAARSFENYVIAKMTIGGYQNDFLANVVSIDEFARSDGRYPYLLNEEMPPIEKAFDDLFETIEAVETENGIALAKLIEADNAPVASLATARVKKMIAPLQAELKGTPIEVVDSVADLPEVIQKWAKERGYTDSLQAVYHNGKAYVVANHIKSERQVTRAVLHEVVGHAGIKGVLGDKINPVLDQIADSMKGKAQLPNGVDIGKAYGLDWSKPAERREIVEEYIAHLAESGENPGFVRLVAAKIRELLRKIYPALKWTDADIIGLLAQSRKYVSKVRSTGFNGGDPAAMVAYHGTPHKFDKFSLKAMGTGEGNQAYGWGLYFASDRSVADWYRETLSSDNDSYKAGGVSYRRGTPEWKALGMIYNRSIADVKSLLKTYQKDLQSNEAYIIEQGGKDFVDRFASVVSKFKKKDIKPEKGHLYQVDIPEDDQLLDWDEALSDQPDAVRQALAKEQAIYRESEGETGAYINDVAGHKIYEEFKRFYGSAEAASKRLNEIGIPGLKYLDGTSRNKKKGNYNYVIWDENVVTVEAVNDELRQSSGADPLAQLSDDTGKGSPIWEAAVAKGLDMSKAARMERAKAMGFDVDNIAYHATTNDFTAFDPSFIGSNYGLDEEGFFFSSDPEVVSTMETPSANQRMDVYLPSNLKRIEVKGSPTAWLDAQDKQDLFSDAKNDDFAGIAVRNTKTGETTYVVFDPSQIRSINAAFDPDQADSPDIRAKLATMSADFDTIANETMATPASQLPFFKRVWSVIKERYLPESMRELKQGMIDKFHSIETLEKGQFGDLLDGSASAYKAAMRTQNLGSVIEVAMHKGSLVYRNGSVEIRPGSKGFMQIFKDVSDQQMMREWEVWAAAKRASRLITEGKEKNFSQAQIDTVMNEVNGKPAVKALFERTHAEYQQFNKEMLDFAEQAGLIDATERAVWEKDDYVPFHRVKELDDATGPDGPRKKKGLSGQRSGIQQLTGGAGRISIVESIVLNTSHLIDASFRNIAMQRIADLGEQTGVMTRLKNAPKLSQAELDAKLDEMGYDVAGLDPAKKKALEKLIQQHELKGDGVVSVSVGGKLRTYKVEDPLLFRSIASLGHHGVEGIMHLFRGAKRLLTAAVTADPAFMLRNFVRDSLSTAVTVDAKIKPLASAISKLTGSEDLRWKIMAAGGGGGGFYDTAPDDVRSHLSKLTKTSGVIRTTKDLWEAWQRFGSRFENANRLAVADKLLQDGASVAEVAHEAQDVMNFTRTGDYAAMKILVEMIPFMNARIQGLDRLWRGAVSNTPQGRQFRKQFWMRGAIITAATLALLAANWDNDDYWALPEWDRDTYYHFFIGDEHLRLPKPFEVGAIFSTIPERAFEQMRDDANGKLFAERMLHMVQDTFAVGQIPQLFKPAYEVAANVNSFTDRPIISYGLSFVKPEAQYDPWTSETMRMVADAMPDFAPEWMRSPKKLEHVMRGYFGTLGSYAVGIADWLAVNTMDLPQPAASRARDWPVLSAFYQTGQGSTKYSGRVYDMSQRVNELQGAIKKYQDEGYKEKAGALKMDNAKKLQARLGLNRAVKQISDYNSLIKKIMNGPYPPDIKRKRIDELQKTKEDFARKTEEKFRMYF